MMKLPQSCSSAIQVYIGSDVMTFLMLLAHGIVVLIVLISLLQFSRGVLMWTEHSAINPDCKDCICVVNRRNQVA